MIVSYYLDGRIHVVQVLEVVEMKNLVMEMVVKNVEQLDLNNYSALSSSSPMVNTPFCILVIWTVVV